MNGGVFYTDNTVETLIDTRLPTPPPSQNLLLDSLRLCNDLVQRDMRYAHLVAGASKMPMSMIWAARNQDELVNDVDLAKLKSLAWNEFIQKRYLPALSAGQSFAGAASSMLEIVQEMNLQRRRFQIMGLHEQVEASEIQLVLHLCQAGILHPTANTHGEYRSLANRFRRHDRFYEAFALAVGAFVCSSAPYTLGAATTRYERDLQFEYKKHTTALFVYVLKQHPGALAEAGVYDEDYVLRISRLIVVWPSGGGGGGGGGGGSGDGFDGGSGGGGGSVYQSSLDRPQQTIPDVQSPQGKDPSSSSLLDAVVTAQTMAEKAECVAHKAMRAVAKEVGASNETLRKEIGAVKDKLNEEGATRNRITHELKEHCSSLVIGWLTSTWKKDEDIKRQNPVFTEIYEQLKNWTGNEVDRRTREQTDLISIDLQKKLDKSIGEMQNTVSGITQNMQRMLNSTQTSVEAALADSLACRQSMANAEAAFNQRSAAVDAEQMQNAAHRMEVGQGMNAAIERIAGIEARMAACENAVGSFKTYSIATDAKLEAHGDAFKTYSAATDTTLKEHEDELKTLNERNDTKIKEFSGRLGYQEHRLTLFDDQMNDYDSRLEDVSDQIMSLTKDVDNQKYIIVETLGAEKSDDDGALFMPEDRPTLPQIHQALVELDTHVHKLYDTVERLDETTDEKHEQPDSSAEPNQSPSRKRPKRQNSDGDESIPDGITIDTIVQRVLDRIQPANPTTSPQPAAPGHSAAASEGGAPQHEEATSPALHGWRQIFERRMDAMEQRLRQALSGGTRPPYEEQTPALSSANLAPRPPSPPTAPPPPPP
jgi:hypothetical protein